MDNPSAGPLWDSLIVEGIKHKFLKNKKKWGNIPLNTRWCCRLFPEIFPYCIALVAILLIVYSYVSDIFIEIIWQP